MLEDVGKIAGMEKMTVRKQWFESGSGVEKQKAGAFLDADFGRS